VAAAEGELGRLISIYRDNVYRIAFDIIFS